MVNISDGVGQLTAGVGAISLGMESLQATAAITTHGINTLLSRKSSRPLTPSPLACDFARKHHELLHLEGRQDGIARWLIGTVAFQTWLTGSGKTIWCYGIRNDNQ